MKKLVYILVAVFTMIGVNANAGTYNLHFCYPGCDENEINETIWVDDNTAYKNGTVYNESKEVIDWNLPTCKGYKFVGFYTKVDNSLRAKVIYPFEDGYVITSASSEGPTPLTLCVEGDRHISNGMNSCIKIRCMLFPLRNSQAISRRAPGRRAWLQAFAYSWR